MGSMLVSSLSYTIQQWLTGLEKVLFSVLTAVAANALTLVNMTWVKNTEHVAAGVAVLLLVLRFSWEALYKYVLFNEGTPDTTGSNLWKGLARAVFFMAADAVLVDHVFSWGLGFAYSLASAPLTQSVVVAHGLGNSIASATGVIGGSVVFAVLCLVAAVVGGLVVIMFQMGYRAAELVFYIVSAPIVAVGQVSADGGVWSNWWKGLLVLSLSQAWQDLALKGLIAVSTYPMIGNTSNGITGLSIADTTVVHSLLAMVFGFGFVIVAIRGPHLLKEWAAHTGLGGAIGGASSAAANRYIGMKLDQIWGK